MDWQYLWQLLKGTFWNTKSFIFSIPAYLGILALIFYIWPWQGKEGYKMRALEILRDHPAAIIMGLLLLSVIASAYTTHANSKKVHQATLKQPRPISATAKDSPASTVIAAGEGSQVTINQSDPNLTDAVNRKLDALLSEVGGDELRRLEKEYDYGFVLIAFSGEIDATRVRPHAHQIHADWERCNAHIDQMGAVALNIPDWTITSDDNARMIFPMLNLAFPASPKSAPITVGNLQIVGEYLQTRPFGHCIVLGFKKTYTPPR